MARHTRSVTTTQDRTDEDTDKAASSSPTSIKSKVMLKKRKRNSGVDSDDLPAPKQAREDDDSVTVKDENADNIEYPPLAGDQPIKEEDAKKILDILELMDNQGLLDRVFPLEQVLESTSPPTPSSSKTPSDSYSLRALLKEPSEHPLRVYRSAIKQLFPISSHPRVKVSTPASQQLKFCQIALGLVEEASKHTIDGLSLRPEIVNPYPSTNNDAIVVKDEPSLGSKRRKYALMQKLPNGEWWTSLNLDAVGAEAELKSFNDLNTGHAELVSILPSPAASLKSTPTLGDLVNGKQSVSRLKLPSPQSLSSGTFLDYGPYATFAPTFDNDGANVGQNELTSVLWWRHGKGKAREKARILGERMREKLRNSTQKEMDVDDVVEVEPLEMKAAEQQKQREKVKELLSTVFTEGEAKTVTDVLDALELEEKVNELLQRNAAALLRLEELQALRLGGVKGGSSDVEVGSEEWEIAQKVADSLILLASMRPRLAKDPSVSILPPLSTLRKVHRTLPSEAAPGWYGTVVDSRGSALRDDTTIYVNPSAASAIPPATPAPKSVATATSLPPVQTPTPAYPAAAGYQQQNYSYTNYQQPYRAAYPQYSAGQQNATAYYGGAYAQGTATPQTATTPAAYPYTNGSQYPYASWYSSYQPPVAPSATPARSTPQPQTTATGVAATYAAYTTPARAVANTVAPKPQVNGWATPVGTTFSAPTIPLAHNTTTPGAPATPYAQNYLANHQPTPSAT